MQIGRRSPSKITFKNTISSLLTLTICMQQIYSRIKSKKVLGKSRPRRLMWWTGRLHSPGHIHRSTPMEHQLSNSEKLGTRNETRKTVTLRISYMKTIQMRVALLQIKLYSRLTRWLEALRSTLWGIFLTKRCSDKRALWLNFPQTW